jgi:site-specific recombinase XerD
MFAIPRKMDYNDFNRLYHQRKDNELKVYLSAYTAKIYAIQRDLMLNNIPVTPTTIKDYLCGNVKGGYTLKDLYNDYLLRYNDNESIKRKYILAFELFVSQHNYDKNVKDITSEDAWSYYNLLREKYEQSTASGKFVRLKAFFNYAVDSGKISSNVFNCIKNVNKGEKEILALNEDEINSIVNIDLSGTLEKVRDLFCFQLGTGLSYIDMMQLSANDVINDNDTLFIQKRRQKTNVCYTTLLLPIAREIWIKYKGELPKISNQKFNVYLKALGATCGIDKNLHSHLARHSFATLLINKGVRLEIIAKALGHSNIRQTQHYSRLQDKKVINEISNFF